MDVYNNVKSICDSAREASRSLSKKSGGERNFALLKMAEAILNAKDEIIEANKKDLENARSSGMKESMQYRLMLNEGRIKEIAKAIVKIADLKDPIGTGEIFTRPNGLEIHKTTVPLGVVAMIYEARPNVTVDSAALCLKTGNAVVLRGGKEAIYTNTVLVKLMKQALDEIGIDPHSVELVESTERESANILMNMKGYVDVLIPRGGKGLIRSVAENAKVPVIETGAGNCHVYVDESADIDMAISIVTNAKCSRPSVCNAA
jgi:glutamate-5-semialdehyde dehydrogenase